MTFINLNQKKKKKKESRVQRAEEKVAEKVISRSEVVAEKGS